MQDHSVWQTDVTSNKKHYLNQIGDIHCNSMVLNSTT